MDGCRGVLLALAFGLLAHAEEIPYEVPNVPWEEGLGHHRAVVRVDRKAGAVLANLPWRRSDRDPDKKQIIVVDGATGTQLTNVFRVSVERESAVLAFEPRTVPGEYFIYYLPYTPQPGWGRYKHDYLAPRDTADAAWRERLPPNISQLPAARLLRFEARTALDSFYPMAVAATAAETKALIERNPQPYLVFAEDRRHPIRMRDDLPLRWIDSGPRTGLQGEAQSNEYYAFQIGLYAARQPIEDIGIEFAGPRASWLKCFNLGGINWDGKPFRKSVSVPAGKVQALWFGVDMPPHAKAGEERATVIIRPKNAPPATVHLSLKVLPSELADRGDSEPWRHSRLRWLDSTLGSDDDVVAPYPPLQVKGRTVQCLGRSVRFADSGLPESIRAKELELLAAPMRVVIETGNGPLTMKHQGLKQVKRAAGVVQWESNSAGGSVSLRSVARMEFDGHIGFEVSVKAQHALKLNDIRLEIPVRRELAAYLMGIGRRGGYRPGEYTWRWEGPYDSFWIGDVQAGLHCELRGGSYHGPMLNLYKPAPPPSWHNGGQGGVTIADTADGQALVRVFTGAREVAAGKTLNFEFALLITPVKPVDTAQHFRERYYHSTQDIPVEANVVNVHHATEPNPWINYPFLSVDRLQEFFRPLQARGAKVKIYYTVRELTARATELWALRSLGDEVLAGGPGGGFPWLREHLAGDYTPQWYTVVPGWGVDPAILTSGASRWYNYYIEGLNWLVKNVPIDGLYLDDVAYDRTILKRMRKVMERNRPGCMIDLHSNTRFSIGPANQYAEFLPYVDRLWFGEGFDYEAMTPDQWLVEASGIPFGLMSDMLQRGGNRWRGMVYGMTARLPHLAADPRPVWKVWDEFGIADSRMIGYWQKDCPVRTGRDDVLATAYVKDGKTLVSLGSWAPQEVQCRLRIDWQALGLSPDEVKLVAPGVQDFQPARQWMPDEAIPVSPGKGWLILIEQRPSTTSMPR